MRAARPRTKLVASNVGGQALEQQSLAEESCLHLEFPANFLAALDTDKRVGDGFKPLLGNFSSTDPTVHSYTALSQDLTIKNVAIAGFLHQNNVLNARLEKRVMLTREIHGHEPPRPPNRLNRMRL